jgi:Protein of unknown function (DUF4199)
MQKQTHITYGAITGLIMVIFSLVLHVTGLSFNKALSYIVYLPFIIGIIMNAMAYSKANDGFVTFGNVFSSSFKLSAVVTLAMFLWCLVLIFVFPETKEKAIEAARNEMAKNPQATDEQIEIALSITKKYFAPILIAGNILGSYFFSYRRSSS